MRLLIAGVVGAGLVLTAAVRSGCSAAEPSPAGATSPVFAALAGTALPTSQLRGERARGIMIGNAIASATVLGNKVGANTQTGDIYDIGHSISNNTGITTVFQNTGNNSLIQNTMTITINAH
jgi:hypothetical protein